VTSAPTEIRDPTTGVRIVFDEEASDDETLVCEEWRPANLDPPPAHYHPGTVERFVVRDGLLVVRTEGVDHRVEPGETFVVEAGTPHVSFTADDPVRLRRELTPPGRWRAFLTDRFACAHAAAGRSGAGRVFETARLLRTYPDVVVLARPPRPVQRVLLSVLATVGRATGRGPPETYPSDDEAGPGPDPE
jgi:mannose-6-phosphate isomerase-like protein (cupin superfamily)